MNLKYADNQCPRLAGGFKLAVAAVFVGLVVAAGQSPIDWAPMTATVHDAAATATAPVSSRHDPSVAAPETADATPHIEAF